MRELTQDIDVFRGDDSQQEEQEVTGKEMKREEVAGNGMKSQQNARQQEDNDAWIIETGDERGDQVEFKEDIDEP